MKKKFPNGAFCKVCAWLYDGGVGVGVLCAGCLGHGVLCRPLLSVLVVGGCVGFVHAGNFWHERIVRVRVAEQRTYWKQYLGNCQGRRPLGSQDIKTDGPVAVDVRMVYSCCECNLWRLEWVICWKVNGQKEDSSLVWTVWWSHNGCLPLKQIIWNWASWAVSWWVLFQIL